MLERNWIVVVGQLLDDTRGGGFEFFGPYHEHEAKTLRERMQKDQKNDDRLALAIQLIRHPEIAQ